MEIIRTQKCPVCDRKALIEVEVTQPYRDWKAGRITLEDAYPKMPPKVREIIRTGIHPECKEKDV